MDDRTPITLGLNITVLINQTKQGTDYPYYRLSSNFSVITVKVTEMHCKYLCDFWIPSFKEDHVLIIPWFLNKDINNSTNTDTKFHLVNKKNLMFSNLDSLVEFQIGDLTQLNNEEII